MKSLKIKYLFILLLLFTLSLSAQNEAPNRIDSQGKKQGFWKKYEKGILIYEGNFQNNIPVGEFKYYHPNGKLKSITFFINGVQKVKTTIFHDNEQKASEGIFIDQIKDGEWKYWGNNGILIKEENYKLGKKEGAWIIYSAETGIKLQEDQYLNDKLHGICKIFYIDGKLNNADNYINGKRNGLSESYYYDQKISSKGIYHENLKIGSWEYYDYDGNLRRTIEFDKSVEKKRELYFYGKQNLKFDEEQIAYYHSMDDETIIVKKNGEKVSVSESLTFIQMWANSLIFTPVTPFLYVANNAIKGYTELEEDVISVRIIPDPGEEVIAEGNEAQAVRSVFVRELPKEE